MIFVLYDFIIMELSDIKLCRLIIYIICYTVFVKECNAWQYFTLLKDITLDDSVKHPKETHSEYYYGDCKREGKRLQAHVFKTHLEILGKIIIRGWLDLTRVPICIILRARAFEVDLFRSTAYNFQICVPRITYSYSHTRFKYYYYEWYIPRDVIGGMDWDLYFYAPAEDAYA